MGRHRNKRNRQIQRMQKTQKVAQDRNRHNHAVHYHGGEFTTFTECLRVKSEMINGCRTTMVLAEVTCKQCRKGPCFKGALVFLGPDGVVEDRSASLFLPSIFMPDCQDIEPEEESELNP